MGRVFASWSAIFLTAVVFEGIASGIGAFTFDGNQPFEIGGYGLYLAWLNAIGFMTIGALLLFLVPRLRGQNKLLLITVPLLSHLGLVFTSALPIIISLNWNVSVMTAWLLGALSLALSLTFAWTIAVLAGTTTHEGESSRKASATSPEGSGEGIPRATL